MGSEGEWLARPYVDLWCSAFRRMDFEHLASVGHYRLKDQMNLVAELVSFELPMRFAKGQNLEAVDDSESALAAMHWAYSNFDSGLSGPW